MSRHACAALRQASAHSASTSMIASGGYREYSDTDADRLTFIKTAQRLGLSLRRADKAMLRAKLARG